MTHQTDFLRVLKETSRTFFIPIARLPARLQEAVASAYLCMRAIDELEDHPVLANDTKAGLLRGLSQALQAQLGSQNPANDSLLVELFAGQRSQLPEVTLRIGEWLALAPPVIAPRIWDATIAMADRMACWADQNWTIHSEADLDGYTFSVAGAVGLLLCDIWAWFDGAQIDRLAAICFGRGLQSVNILRNRKEDIERGVDFFPAGWTEKQVFAYAHRNLALARAGVAAISRMAFKHFMEIPLALAEATLQALEHGQPKLSRQQVMQIVSQV